LSKKEHLRYLAVIKKPLFHKKILIQRRLKY